MVLVAIDDHCPDLIFAILRLNLHLLPAVLQLKRNFHQCSYSEVGFIQENGMNIRFLSYNNQF